jgi:4,5-dihydroxyphthalate decarboxylase
MSLAPCFEVSGGAYGHVDGLAGEYCGVRLEYRATSPRQIFEAMLEHKSYEVCEFSLANYLILRGSGEHWLTATPIFPYRAFRHSPVLVRKDSPLTDFTGLRGKRVGIDDYSMTAAVWLRGLLLDEYGVDHRSITWVSAAKQRLPIPALARVERTEANLETLLVEGKIDAWLGMSRGDAALPDHERKLRPILPNPHGIERDYFARTRCFPINHCVVIRNDALARVPDLPRAVAMAYGQAKTRAYQRKAQSILPWGMANWDADMKLFGGDPLPYGLDDVNRSVVGTLARYLHEQGFIRAVPVIDDVFA